MGVVMESKIVPAYQNRRLERRHPLPPDAGAALYFQYPSPNGPSLEAPLRDVSLSGLSMNLPDELAGIQPGDIVKGIEARVARKSFRGDLLIMHVTPSTQSRPFCGGLFYPEGDEDLITIRLVVRALEAASKK